MCKLYAPGSCNFGQRCMFAHGEAELRGARPRASQSSNTKERTCSLGVARPSDRMHSWSDSEGEI
eukprot:2952744-Karenia_brevis.AAC.1